MSRRPHRRYHTRSGDVVHLFDLIFFLLLEGGGASQWTHGRIWKSRALPCRKHCCLFEAVTVQSESASLFVSQFLVPDGYVYIVENYCSQDILFLPFTIYWMWATYYDRKKKRQKKETNQKGKKSHVEVLCVYTFPGGTYINDTFFLCFS